MLYRKIKTIYEINNRLFVVYTTEIRIISLILINFIISLIIKKKKQIVKQ